MSGDRSRDRCDEVWVRGGGGGGGGRGGEGEQRRTDADWMGNKGNHTWFVPALTEASEQLTETWGELLSDVSLPL